MRENNFTPTCFQFVRKKLYQVIASREMKSSTDQAGEVQIAQTANNKQIAFSKSMFTSYFNNHQDDWNFSD